MNNNTEKAVVAMVSFGQSEFEGLQLPDGEFAIAMSQLAVLGLVPPGRSSNQLKKLLALDIECIQVKSDLTSRAVNAIKLDQFERVLVCLVAKGRAPAIELWNNIYPDKAINVPKKKESCQV